MEEIEASVPVKRKVWLSPRQKNCLEGLYVVALVAIVVATHFHTAGNNRGYLFGTAETTLAAAMAFALFTPLIGMRIIDFSKRLSGDRSIIAVMVGTIVLLSGGVPLALLASNLDKQIAVTDAYMRGYSAVARTVDLAEKQPQDLRKIGVVVRREILREAFWSFPQYMIEEMDEKIAAGWKELGLEKPEGK